MRRFEVVMLAAAPTPPNMIQCVPYGMQSWKELLKKLWV